MADAIDAILVEGAVVEKKGQLMPSCVLDLKRTL